VQGLGVTPAQNQCKYVNHLIFLLSCINICKDQLLLHNSHTSTRMRSMPTESGKVTVPDRSTCAKDNQEGIDVEYEIISEMLGERFIDWELVRQTLIQEEDKSYDQLEIKSVVGNYIFWFDITDFFGKWNDLDLNE
jgi:hypothetical protein